MEDNNDLNLTTEQVLVLSYYLDDKSRTRNNKVKSYERVFGPVKHRTNAYRFFKTEEMIEVIESDIVQQLTREDCYAKLKHQYEKADKKDNIKEALNIIKVMLSQVEKHEQNTAQYSSAATDARDEYLQESGIHNEILEFKKMLEAKNKGQAVKEA